MANVVQAIGNMAGNAAHGKETLRWCDACGTLLLGDSCSECGSSGREFRINSPGDIRPCMGESVDMILSLFHDAFGTDGVQIADLDGAFGVLHERSVDKRGGKDSLAAFALAREAAPELELINIDTGLEFPETVEYVERFARVHRLKIHQARGENGFKDNVDSFGPPAKDFRWCCKVCKLGPVTDVIERDFPRGTVTVEGNRRLESFARSQIGFVTRNPFVPNQINLNPIRAWSAAEVWAYILLHDLEYNPLYDRDFERIGCYLCPACLESEWRNTKRIHPELASQWDAYLKGYAESRGLPPRFRIPCTSWP